MTETAHVGIRMQENTGAGERSRSTESDLFIMLVEKIASRNRELNVLLQISWRLRTFFFSLSELATFGKSTVQHGTEGEINENQPRLPRQNRGRTLARC